MSELHCAFPRSHALTLALYHSSSIPNSLARARSRSAAAVAQRAPAAGALEPGFGVARVEVDDAAEVGDGRSGVPQFGVGKAAVEQGVDVASDLVVGELKVAKALGKLASAARQMPRWQRASASCGSSRQARSASARAASS